MSSEEENSFNGEEMVDSFVSEFDGDEDPLQHAKTRTNTKRRRRKAAPRLAGKQWPEEDIDKLIGLIESHSCLWDSMQSENKERDTRETAWCAVADCFGGRFTRNDCRAKWQNLRTMMRRVEGDMRKSGLSRSVGPKWKFYLQMLFVSTINPMRNNVSFTNTPAPITSSTGIKTDKSDKSDNEHLTPPLPTPSPFIAAASSSGMAIRQKRKVPPMQYSIAAKKDRPETQLQTQPEVNPEPHGLRNQTEDEFEIFGKFIASELRNLPNLNRARRMKLKLQAALTNFLLEESEENNSGWCLQSDSYITKL